MDHVFNMLETYASNLESEVEDRTKQLVEEKKKSDILLYRMLPKQVADKLKLGQSVEPETYDSVTVFFSDVVSFTKIAGRCSPLQVVNLLNDLYTAFDGIIDSHDVETIGDGYLCVSGLPHRNGQEHIKEICSMSLAFMKSLNNFKIPHLPQERINLRIGAHTAGMIHLSAEANHLLNVVGGFLTESRGEVIIKGKGVMETFWLLGKADGLKQPLNSNPSWAEQALNTALTPFETNGSLDQIQNMSEYNGIYADFKKKNEIS
ncbi:unnamed protein product [Strongylus vulgaris]|uniref:guanylate cyclase n=1 Tax=Strongylus vulgaris TaxID=40348 RepID=A0A3P7J2V4_STRVU|nr:unnamed protein product [Strongylus vulgaris]